MSGNIQKFAIAKVVVSKLKKNDRSQFLVWESNKIYGEWIKVQESTRWSCTYFLLVTSENKTSSKKWSTGASDWIKNSINSDIVHNIQSMSKLFYFQETYSQVMVTAERDDIKNGFWENKIKIVKETIEYDKTLVKGFGFDNSNLEGFVSINIIIIITITVI